MPTLAEDRDDIRDLLARLCLYRDTGPADKWAALFTNDAELCVRRKTIIGREALKAYAEGARSGMHHMLMDHVVDVHGDTATCQASLLTTSKGEIHLTARAHDELRRVDGSWRIARRSYTVDPR